MAILAFLKTLPDATTKEIASAVMAEELVRKRGYYWYDPDARWPMLRALSSLEKRGKVVSKGLVRGEDTETMKQRRDRDGYSGNNPYKGKAPTRERLWAIAPPDYTSFDAALAIEESKVIARLEEIRRYVMRYLKENSLESGEDSVILEDADIAVAINNFAGRERWLNADERDRGHVFVAGIDCKRPDIGYIRASGPTAIEAAQSALAELIMLVREATQKPRRSS